MALMGVVVAQPVGTQAQTPPQIPGQGPAEAAIETPPAPAREPEPADRVLGQTASPAPSAEPAPVAPPAPPAERAAPDVPAPPPVQNAAAPPKEPEPPPVNGLRLIARTSAYLTAQRRAIHAPFVAQTGTPIVVLAWPAAGSPLQELANGQASWDLAEVDSDEAARACEAGQLEKIDSTHLAKGADGALVEQDFIAGGLTACSVASVSWSSLIAYDKRAWPAQAQTAGARGAKRTKAAVPTAARTPSALRDLFDVAALPGKRALRRTPRYLLEMSLIADGVAPDQVYRTLATEAGTDRAFDRLEALRGHIIWVETPAAASAQLAERKAVMAMLYSGRAFQHVAVEAKPYGLIWDGQIYHLDAWVVPKGSRQAQKAREWVAFATDPVRLAALSEQFPYGPARASAVARVGRHPILKTDMVPYLPTSPANLRTAVPFDARFWAANEQRLSERFGAWLLAPLPKPEPAAPMAPAGTGSSPDAPAAAPQAGQPG